VKHLLPAHSPPFPKQQQRRRRAWRLTDTGKPYRTENAVHGVAKDNPWGRRFHDAATDLWGQLHPYTGY
jgi:hypothetical protein